jgi:hypothetical protein
LIGYPGFISDVLKTKRIGLWVAGSFIKKYKIFFHTQILISMAAVRGTYKFIMKSYTSESWLKVRWVLAKPTWMDGGIAKSLTSLFAGFSKQI